MSDGSSSGNTLTTGSSRNTSSAINSAVSNLAKEVVATTIQNVSLRKCNTMV